MRTFLRWWETLSRPERIVAMSLATGGIVGITNSTVWAIAVCYMTRQKAEVAMWKATRAQSTTRDSSMPNHVEADESRLTSRISSANDASFRAHEP